MAKIVEKNETEKSKSKRRPDLIRQGSFEKGIFKLKGKFNQKDADERMRHLGARLAILRKTANFGQEADVQSMREMQSEWVELKKLRDESEFKQDREKLRRHRKKQVWETVKPPKSWRQQLIDDGVDVSDADKERAKLNAEIAASYDT
jgi:hypothetical protein